MTCKYCTEEPKLIINKKISILGMKTYLMMDIFEGRIELGGLNEIIARKEINYCPMCGRKLNHKQS